MFVGSYCQLGPGDLDDLYNLTLNIWFFGFYFILFFNFWDSLSPFKDPFKIIYLQLTGIIDY